MSGAARESQLGGGGLGGLVVQVLLEYCLSFWSLDTWRRCFHTSALRSRETFAGLTESGTPSASPISPQPPCGPDAESPQASNNLGLHKLTWTHEGRCKEMVTPF